MANHGPRPARTVLAFMVNFMFDTPGFIARRLPLYSLKYEFWLDQLMILITIIHAADGVMFLVMTDNLSVNQKFLKGYIKIILENHLQQLRAHI